MVRSLPLNDATEIPNLGFGTWQLTGNTCIDAVKIALATGYRHLDTADAYGNHRQVGQAIKESGTPRSELFLTTKVWHDFLHQADVLSSANRFLDELQTDYLDLLLIHWPNKNIPIQETLQSLDELKKSKKIKAVGVSNFTIHHLEDALKLGVEITNNQVEIHPSLQQIKLRQFCEQHHIVVTAYSPIAQGQDLKLPVVLQLSQKYQKSPSQIILNWIMTKNMVAIPKSSDQAHIVDNFKSTEWTMDPKDITQIDALDTNNRLVNPNFSEFDY